MKKVLLFSILILTTLAVCAYETVIFHFPDGENWEKAYYKKRNNEAILQYVPYRQTSESWIRSIVVHSYENYAYEFNNFVSNELRKMVKINPKGKYQTMKMTNTDAMFTRCTEKFEDVEPHCEFLRVTRAHGGIITIQYMNRDKEDFAKNFTLWQEVIRGAKFYNSYYRDERTFDKSLYFEL